MQEGEIARTESPARHDFHEPALTQELRLKERGQLADSRTREQRGRETCKVVHRKMR